MLKKNASLTVDNNEAGALIKSASKTSNHGAKINAYLSASVALKTLLKTVSLVLLPMKL